MATYGQVSLGKFGGGSVFVSAHGVRDEKIAGVTIAWDTVIAFATDEIIAPSNGTTFATPLAGDDSMGAHFFKAGSKGLRMGTVLCRISGGTLDGKVAPYGSVTNLGGGTLLKTRGHMWVLNTSIDALEVGSDHFPAIEGGKVFLERIVQNGTGAADTLAGPTKAELDAAFPTFVYV